MTEDKGRNDRLKLFEDIKKRRLEAGEDIEDTQAIKNEFIKIFKESKIRVTNILQDELKNQVQFLNKEIVIIYNLPIGRF